MLAYLLRILYVFQLILGALLGSYAAVLSAQHGGGALSLLLIPLSAIALPLLLQFLVILTSMIQSRTGGAALLWWRILWAEYQSAVLIYMLRQPWPRRRNGVRMPRANATGETTHSAVPVVLVHGFICNHRLWDNMARALHRAGHPVLAVDLEPLFVSIDDYASLIDAAVITLQKQTRSQQIALVGHSMGGLAIRAWLRTLKPARLARVARVITLGTPHQGTSIPQPVTTPNGVQMHWHSDWLQALQASEGSRLPPLMQIALNLHDNICFPQPEQVLRDVPVTEFRGIGHLEMCLNPQVIDWTCQQLADTPATSGPSSELPSSQADEGR
ncbi:alpha/beta fold hydrolase [Rhodoferax sp.]|uniref:alpha/beta fold hydrolase n=1 Tax=Rhodoferax sp. TaxID=50421 RepID=UPI00284C4335|nr:alpha/beta fold hydrolase [Rhodoferax sp.]MDR3370130.1 alpha/beta fold hydrolase [Rhodoferax sp.]